MGCDTLPSAVAVPPSLNTERGKGYRIVRMEKFEKKWLAKLWCPTDVHNKFGAGQITIVGGSSLFHGAPILALKVASRLVSMVYFVAPAEEREVVEKIKAGLSSFIWVPFEEVNEYAVKSDAILIGPGMMRNRNEADGFSCDEAGKKSKEITLAILAKFGGKKCVLDGGALQVIEADDLPKGAVITPNRKEFMMLFREELAEETEAAGAVLKRVAKEHCVVIVHKAPNSIVTDGDRVILVEGGNPGLVKGGVGDVVAGLTVGLLAKNESLLAATTAIYLMKLAADRLAKKFGFMFNADDLAEEARVVFGEEVG